MMISPQTFYERELRGKNAEQINKVIVRLKREMNRLKKTMEHPDYAITMYPTEDTRIWCTREYLQEAMRALEEINAPYIPNSRERRIIEFNENLNHIESIKFTIGGFFGGFTIINVSFAYTEVHYVVNESNERVQLATEEDCNRDAFIEDLRDLHIGEWKSHYDLKRFGMYVLDGTQWEITIQYDNGAKPFTTGGDNAYPYNFERWLEFIGLEDYFEEESEEEDD